MRTLRDVGRKARKNPPVGVEAGRGIHFSDKVFGRTPPECSFSLLRCLLSVT
jgi:hypothetical protein